VNKNVKNVKLSSSPLSKINFQILNEEHNFQNLPYIEIFLEVFRAGLATRFGKGLKSNFVELKGDFLRYAVDIDAYEEAAKHYFELVKNDPAFAEKVNRDLFTALDKVMSYSRGLLAIDYSKKSSKELLEIWNEYAELNSEMIIPGMFPVVMEIHEPYYSDFLTQLVDEKNRKTKAGVSVAEAVAVLSSSQGETVTKREQVELMKIALTAKNSSKSINDLSVVEKIKKHTAEFRWLTYGYGGPAWTEKDFQQSLDGLMKENVGERLAAIELGDVQLEEKRAFYEKKLKFDEKEKLYFKIARDFMKGKAMRKETMSFTTFASEPLHREMAKRLNLSLSQLRFMTAEEIRSALEDKNVDETILSQRAKCLIYGFINNSEPAILAVGTGTGKYSSLIAEKELGDVHELRGTCACSGNAVGLVKIIQRPDDMQKMHKGDILVSYATTPDIVPAMRLAAAIITDMGGLTSHAAIVSREMNIPCVIGTKIATKVLKDGDKVSVDAAAGIVKKL